MTDRFPEARSGLRTKPIDDELLDRVLPRVEQPARYTGGEWNSVRKDWESTAIHFALVYPEIYELGMSNLGLAILYDLLNSQPDVAAERIFAPAMDMEAAMRAAGLPLFSLESRRPLAAFDIVGFSLAYELNYSNVLNMLDLGGIPIWAAERRRSDPLVVGGGSMTYNAEPMTDFFDLFVVGEGEEVVLELLDLYRQAFGERDGRRQEFLWNAAHIRGVYVPSLYRVSYREDGTVGEVKPVTQGIPSSVKRRIVPVLPPPPVRPVVPYIEVVHDRAGIEIQRGCSHGCRFCHAGIVYRPLRERPSDEVLAAVAALLRNTGHEEVSLLALSSTDYHDIRRLLEELLNRHQDHRISFSLPSLRIDAFSVELADLLQQRRKSGLTFAPEAGSQRLRNVVNKGVVEEDLLRTAEAAFSKGWRRIKLYFMMGLPTETDADIEAIADLTYKVRDIGRRTSGKRVEVSVSISTFVPKPFTPFQWTGLLDQETIVRRQQILKQRIKGKGLSVSWHDPASSMLEAVLARGDRRLNRVIHRAWRSGARFDAWNEHFKPELWWAAFDEEGLDPDFYARRERSTDETMPWDHIDVGVSRRFLLLEWERSLRGELSSGCIARCMACGIQSSYEEALVSCQAVCGGHAR